MGHFAAQAPGHSCKWRLGSQIFGVIATIPPNQLRTFYENYIFSRELRKFRIAQHGRVWGLCRCQLRKIIVGELVSWNYVILLPPPPKKNYLIILWTNYCRNIFTGGGTGEKPPVRMIWAFFFTGETYGLGGPKILENVPFSRYWYEDLISQKLLKSTQIADSSYFGDLCLHLGLWKCVCVCVCVGVYFGHPGTGPQKSRKSAPQSLKRVRKSPKVSF